MLRATKSDSCHHLPEVGQLLVQDLALVLPSKRLFSEEVQILTKISEYLFYDGNNVWPTEKFIKIGKKVSEKVHRRL